MNSRSALRKAEGMTHEQKMHWLATANRVTVGKITQMTDTTPGKAIFKTSYVAKVRGLIVGDPEDYKHETPEAASTYGWLILKAWKDNLKLP